MIPPVVLWFFGFTVPSGDVSHVINIALIVRILWEFIMYTPAPELT